MTDTANTSFEAVSAGQLRAIIERIETQIPIGRAGTPEDVAGAVAWLASPDSDYATGQVIELHGGREMVELL